MTFYILSQIKLSIINYINNLTKKQLFVNSIMELHRLLDHPENILIDNKGHQSQNQNHADLLNNQLGF